MSVNFEMSLLVSSIFPKNERKQVNLRYHSSKVQFFLFVFLKIEVTKKTARNWLIHVVLDSKIIFSKTFFLFYFHWISNELSKIRHHFKKAGERISHTSYTMPITLCIIEIFAKVPHLTLLLVAAAWEGLFI